jgi:ribosomal protein S18 acetylase RimI-like enzyme
LTYSKENTKGIINHEIFKKKFLMIRTLDYSMEHERFRAVRVTTENEALFYEYIKDNYAEYFFFHVDYAQYPENTEVYMALDNEGKIQGMVLNWKDRRLQLRGTFESLEFLLKGKNYTPISVTGFKNHIILISRFFPDYQQEKATYRMSLKRGEQKDFEKYPFIELNESYRERIGAMMRIADPIFWGTNEPEDILIDENNIWFGIVENEELVSIVNMWIYQNMGYLTIVGTHPDYWNQGYASSLVSSALKDLFREKDQCFIMVRIANPPAIHTYKKLGFKICNTHYSYEKL